MTQSMQDATSTINASTATPAITCGELLVEWLEYYGVETVFGIPGVHTVELYRGMPNTNIRHVTPRHEQGAGFMADGYYRASGKIGVCFIITGPGMTNIMTAMAQAAADSIPMLVISSVNKVANTGSGEGHLHELFDQQGMVSQVAVASKTIWQPQALPKVIAQAFALFDGARPGPVHIQLPIDIITADASHVAKPPKFNKIPDSSKQSNPSMTALPHKVLRPLPNPSQLDLIVETLKSAKNPILLYGGGCVAVDNAAQQLAELIDAPTFLTINAKGLLPPAHPLSLGSNQSMPAGRKLIAQADVVLAIGTELGETDYDVVFDEGFAINGTLIRIDCDAQQLQRPFRADIAVLADAQAAIDGLCQRLQTQGVDHKGLNHQAKARVSQVKQALIESMPPSFAGQNALLKLIRDEVEEVIIVGDSTQPVYSGNQGFEALGTRKWFNSSTGYGTLGYGLPAAIGAMLATQNPVMSLIGDGGIQFTIAELICAAELELPLIVLLWNNQGYGEIRRYMQERGLPLIGVNIKTPDFEALAAGFGAGYRRITEKAQLIDALQQDIKGTKPIVYEIDEADDFIAEMGKTFTYFS